MKWFRNIENDLGEVDAAIAGFATDIANAASEVVHVASTVTLSRAADTLGKVVGQAKAEVERIDADIAAENSSHARTIADLTEQRRQCTSIIDRCEPAVAGMVEDFHGDQPVPALDAAE